MVKISIMYPNTKNARFDMSYYLAAFHPHAALLQGDMPNYTDLTPMMQVSIVEIRQ